MVGIPKLFPTLKPFRETMNPSTKENRFRLFTTIFVWLLVPTLLLYQIASNYPTLMSPSVQSNSYLWLNRVNPSLEDRVAICVAGDLQWFDLTGPTLQTYVFSAYENADIFVTTVVNPNAYKALVIEGSNIVGFRFIHPIAFPEDKIFKEIISSQSFGSGVQNFALHASLLERCTHLIEKEERKGGFEYDWVLFTRPDGLWNYPPPLLHHLSKDYIYVPKGSNLSETSDSFILTGRDIAFQMMAAMVSSIPWLYKEGKSHLKPENKLLEYLTLLNLETRIVPQELSFCTLTDKLFPFPPDWKSPSTPVVSPIDSPLEGGGRYCRPCRSVPNLPIAQDEAYRIFKTIYFCDSRDSTFVDDWQQVYVKFYGPAVEEKRQLFELNNNFWFCVQFFEELMLKVEIWEGEKDFYEICGRGFSERK